MCYYILPTRKRHPETVTQAFVAKFSVGLKSKGFGYVTVTDVSHACHAKELWRLQAKTSDVHGPASSHGPGQARPD